jgi:hypothetical protein
VNSGKTDPRDAGWRFEDAEVGLDDLEIVCAMSKRHQESFLFTRSPDLPITRLEKGGNFHGTTEIFEIGRV